MIHCVRCRDVGTYASPEGVIVRCYPECVSGDGYASNEAFLPTENSKIEDGESPDVLSIAQRLASEATQNPELIFPKKGRPRIK